MQAVASKSPWESHDWKVKTLEFHPSNGSRLGFTCRSCERKFSYTTGNNRAWAVNGEFVALADDISTRWLAQPCQGRPGHDDDADRLQLKNR